MTEQKYGLQILIGLHTVQEVRMDMTMAVWPVYINGAKSGEVGCPLTVLERLAKRWPMQRLYGIEVLNEANQLSCVCDSAFYSESQWTKKK